MDLVKITLAGVEYSGPPLSLDQLDEITKDNRLVNIVRVWASDPAVTPRPDGGSLRVFPRELEAAANAILGVSEVAPGEALAGADSPKA
jgi:hypothetical protein